MEQSTAFRLAELERRVDNLLRCGTVVAADYPSARVRVKSGDLVTDWVPWLTRRASNDTDWWAPETGEQVLLLCPCGDPAQAVALPAIYQHAHPAPESRPTVHRTEYADGTSTEYDRASGTLSVNCVNRIEIVSRARIDIKGAVFINVEAAARIKLAAARIDWN